MDVRTYGGSYFGRKPVAILLVDRTSFDGFNTPAFNESRGRHLESIKERPRYEADVPLNPVNAPG